MSICANRLWNISSHWCSFQARLVSSCSGCAEWTLDDGAERRTPPGPVVVCDDVARVGDQWSVVGVELTRLVSGTVVVQVTDRWQRTVGQAMQTNVHLDSTRHFVDHLLSLMNLPLPRYNVPASDIVVILLWNYSYDHWHRQLLCFVSDDHYAHNTARNCTKYPIFPSLEV